MSASLKARIVRVNVEQDKVGLYFATSEDLKGLLVAERTLEDLAREIPVSIQRLYEACGERVVILPAEQDVENPLVQSWVKVPAGACRELEVTAL